MTPVLYHFYHNGDKGSMARKLSISVLFIIYAKPSNSFYSNGELVGVNDLLFFKSVVEVAFMIKYFLPL